MVNVILTESKSGICNNEAGNTKLEMVVSLVLVR